MAGSTCSAFTSSNGMGNFCSRSGFTATDSAMSRYLLKYYPYCLYCRIGFRAERAISRAEARVWLGGLGESQNFLPDAAGFRRLGEHWVALLAAEGLAELRHVRDSAVDPEAGWRVRISLRGHPQLLFAAILTPNLAETEEEALFCAVSIQLRRGLAGHRQTVHEREVGKS